MDLTFQDAKSKWSVVAVSLALAIFLGCQAVKIWTAYIRVHTDNPSIMQRGAILEPGNADAWDRLGRYYQWSFTDPDPALAAKFYRRAISDDPHSAHLFMDLASAYEASGDALRANQAWREAQSVYPSSAEVNWNYGNYLLRQGEVPEAYAEIQKAVVRDPLLFPIAISRTWRARHDSKELLDHVIPAKEDFYFQALGFFSSIQQPDAALLVWERLMQLGKPFPLSKSFLLIDLLRKESRSREARIVWMEALTAAGLPHLQPENQSLVWNGDFSQDFANGGLGWRWQSAPGATANFDTAPAGHGGRSVRLDFNGGYNIDLAQPAQNVPVEPSSKYHFHAYMRTNTITTESGPRFYVANALNLAEVTLTDGFTGTHAWTPLDLEITTGPSTYFLVIGVHRAPSRLFDNKLSGAAWIADVSLIPEPAASSRKTDRSSR